MGETLSQKRRNSCPLRTCACISSICMGESPPGYSKICSGTKSLPTSWRKTGGNEVGKKLLPDAEVHGKGCAQNSRIYTVRKQIDIIAAQFAQTEQRSPVSKQACRNLPCPCSQLRAGEKIPLFLKDIARQLHAPVPQGTCRGKLRPHGQAGRRRNPIPGTERALGNGIDDITIRVWIDDTGDDLSVFHESFPLFLPEAVRCIAESSAVIYSTVTLFARLRG